MAASSVRIRNARPTSERPLAHAETQTVVDSGVARVRMRHGSSTRHTSLATINHQQLHTTVDILVRDLRYSARKLMRTPAFTAIVIGTLSLAIGATTAVFSIVNGVLLEPLSLRDPQRVVAVFGLSRDGKRNPLSYRDFMDYRAGSKLVPAMSALDIGTHTLTGTSGEPLRLSGMRVNANFFDVIGVAPILGRTFIVGEDAENAARSV